MRYRIAGGAAGTRPPFHGFTQVVGIAIAIRIGEAQDRINASGARVRTRNPHHTIRTLHQTVGCGHQDAGGVATGAAVQPAHMLIGVIGIAVVVVIAEEEHAVFAGIGHIHRTIDAGAQADVVAQRKRAHSVDIDLGHLARIVVVIIRVEIAQAHHGVGGGIGHILNGQLDQSAEQQVVEHGGSLRGPSGGWSGALANLDSLPPSHDSRWKCEVGARRWRPCGLYPAYSRR